jgi:hypothetical protein
MNNFLIVNNNDVPTTYLEELYLHQQKSNHAARYVNHL